MRGNVSTPVRFLIFSIFVWIFAHLADTQSALSAAARFVSRESLSFTAADAGEMYLNVVILASLIGYSQFSLAIKVLKHAVISLITLFFIHIFIITAYAYTHIWAYVRSLETGAGEELAHHVSGLFPESMPSLLSAILFQWNTWGWDVLPIVI